MIAPETFRLQVAPMMDWTDRYCRSFHRVLSRHTRLYTEMVTTGAVIHGPRERLLGFDPDEHPVAVQLGGSNPHDLAIAARLCAETGYDEINLNVGCPSDRVQDGRFGACLMAEPQLVGECVAAMKAVVSIPVTVKCRIGIDDQDTEQSLDALADAVVSAGVDALIVHARKAWLKGLSPKENRDIPPLDYHRVYRLKQRLPQLLIAINGGITSLEQARDHLCHVDGVMIGRAAYQDPALLLGADALVFGDQSRPLTADEAIELYLPYVEKKLEEGVRLSNITRHMLGLYNGLPGARAFRRHLSTEAVKPGADIQVIREAVAGIADARRAAAA